MMTFCRKSLHSLLGFTATSMEAAAAVDTDTDDHHPRHCQALGLVTATTNDRSPNVLECSSPLIKTNSQPNNSPPPLPKKDPGGIGFIDDIGGGVDGLMSCTESLGFESSDERRVDDDAVEEELIRPMPMKKLQAKLWRRRRTGGAESKVVKKFPPPITSLNKNGQLSFYLRPVRKDGRLELTEVRINRPEILRAHREDGRLRLHLIRDDEDEEPIGEEEEEEEREEREQQEDEKHIETEEEEKEERHYSNNGEEWTIPVSSGGGEGFRRCVEVANHRDHHHHHHLHVWRQHCVTTR